MESYIQDCRQEGKLDSEGVFTVDTLGALRKTLASSLPEPHYYLFQITQGLVAAGAQNIEIAIGRHATRFHFDDPGTVFADLEVARERLFKGLTLSSPRPLDLLLTGMATAVGTEMDRADLHPAWSADILQIALDQVTMVHRPEAALEKRSLLELHRSVSKGLSFAWTRIWGARGEEGDLQRRFEFVNPAIKIAGLATSPGGTWRQEVPQARGCGRLILMETAVLDSTLPNHRAPRFPDLSKPSASEVRCCYRKAFNDQGDALALAADAPEWQTRRWSFYRTAGRDAQSTLWWIRNGMTVEETYADLDLPGVLILAPADGLDLDASGYAIVRNEKFEARVRQAGELGRKTLSSVTREQFAELLQAPGLHLGTAASQVQGEEPVVPPTAQDVLEAFDWT